MKFAGIDLHKQTITICVVDQSRNILMRKRLHCANDSHPAIYGVYQIGEV